MIEALFLDLDGTLADSLPAMIEVYHRFLAGFGLRGSPEEFDRLNGPTLRQVVEILRTGRQLPGDVDDLYRRYIALVENAYATRVRPRDGAEAVARFARSRGWTLGLVTANVRGAVDRFLEAADLHTLFNVVITAEDEPAGKPDPAVYRLALRRAGLHDPARALAVEDSPNGVAAARAAGIPVIQFLTEDAPAHVGAVAHVRTLSDLIPLLRERADA